MKQAYAASLCLPHVFCCKRVWIETIVKRINALKRKKDFRYTYRTGKSVQHRLFSCIVARSRLEVPRVGITVSKKQGNSVIRNRIKRRIREAVTPLIPELTGNKNIILVARNGICEVPFEELQAAVRMVFERANVLKREETDETASH